MSKEKSAQGLVEYGLILGLIALVAVTVLMTMGNNIKNSIDKANSQLQSQTVEY